MGKWMFLWAGALGAVSIWLGFPNDLLEFPLLIFFWPCCLVFLGLVSNTRKQAFLRGWLTSFAGMVAALYWLALPMHLVGGLPWVGAASCALFVSACLATQGGFFSLLVFLNRHLSSCLFALLLALCWIFLEIIYAIIIGFPWLPLAGALAPCPILVQSAEILGMYGTSALWLLALFLLLFAQPGIRQMRLSAHYLLLSFLIMAALLCHGYWRLAQEPALTEKNATDSLPVVFVEGNIDQAQKWLPAFQIATVDRYIQLSLDRLRISAPDLQNRMPLVIWPETALPYFFGQNAALDSLVERFVQEQKVPLLFGAPAEDRQSYAEKEPSVFNRAWLLDKDGSIAGHYDKEHLVPFGEYVPSLLNLSFLAGLLQEVGMYTPGTHTKPIRLNERILGILICYEGIFPWLAQNRVADGANILIDISNDGWFLRTPAARQHLYLTSLRAIEQGRYVLRGTNTGISAVIDPRGRIVWRGGQFQTTSHLAWAECKKDYSFYHKYSIWLAACGFFTLVALFFISRYAKKDII